MKKLYKIDGDGTGCCDVIIPWTDQVGLHQEKLKEAVTVYFEDSFETGEVDVEQVLGDAANGFVVIACVDPDLDGLIEELKLVEIK
jgi:hypothetical protein